MPPVITDAFLTLAALDFAAIVQFYRQLLNQEPDPAIPDVYAEFHLPNLKLGIFKPKQTPADRTAATRMSLCLEVENLDAAIAHLVQLGYPPSGNILAASHGREIYVYDPDGNWLILHQSGSAGDQR